MPFNEKPHQAEETSNLNTLNRFLPNNASCLFATPKTDNKPSVGQILNSLKLYFTDECNSNKSKTMVMTNSDVIPTQVTHIIINGVEYAPVNQSIKDELFAYFLNNEVLQNFESVKPQEMIFNNPELKALADDYPNYVDSFKPEDIEKKRKLVALGNSTGEGNKIEMLMLNITQKLLLTQRKMS
jgi:hypothetical protein